MSLVAVFGSAGNETNFDLVERWSALGVQATLLADPDSLGALGPGDTVVGRIDVRPTLDGVRPGLPELHAAAEAGVNVLNPPAALMNAHDKLRTARLLAEAGLPHPRTAHVRAGMPLPFAAPLVLKPRFGSWGQDVLRCDSEEEALALLASLEGRTWFRRQGAIVQELVPPMGHDLRVVVAGGVVVGAEIRDAAPGDWRTNVSLGGVPRPIAAPPPGTGALAVAAAAALGGDFFGVDLLPVGSGFTIIEANAAVDFDIGYSLPGSDIFADVAAALRLPRVQPPVRRLARVAGDQGGT